MPGLTGNWKSAISIAVAMLVLTLVALAISLTEQSRPAVQAHEDDTIHIHPTLTPTPLPALGLNGPLTLETGVIYQKQQHRLVVTAVVNNAPPEGWQFSPWDSHVYVNVEYKGWSFGTNAGADDSQVTLQNNVLVANLPLPEYVDLERLVEPMIARIDISVRYYSDRGQVSLHPSETMYVDLHDRGNWRQ